MRKFAAFVVKPRLSPLELLAGCICAAALRDGAWFAAISLFVVFCVANGALHFIATGGSDA